MSRPSTPSSTNKPAGSRSHRDDVLQFLDNLDSYQGTPPPSAGPGSGSGSSKNASSSAKSSTSAAVAGDKEDPQSVLDFLDEIVTSRERRAPAAATATSGSATASKRNTVASTSSAGGLPRSGSRSTLRDSTSSGRGSYLTPRESTTPTPAAVSPSNNATAATGTSTAAQAAEKLEAAPLPEPASASASTSGGGGWGWGSVWSQATNIVQQAKTVAEEQVSKNLPKNLPQLPVSPSTASAQGAAALSTATDRAQAWRSGALSFLSDNLSNLDIEKLRKDITDTGFKALKDVMDAVAPPIAQHEVIQVNLSHDMVGYEGVETLVYRSLAKIMEQVPGGDLVVNKGTSEDVPNHEKGTRSSFDETAVLNNPEGTAQDDDRNLNLVEGFAEAYKLADANLEAMIKKTYKPPTSDASESEKPKAHARTTSITVPVTICPVYMRIQPVLAPLPFPSSSSSTPSDASTSEEKHLYFILLLRDPTNSLVHRTLTQSMPKAWLDIPFEENEWVEDIMVDVIRRGVEILGEEYVKGRMSGRLLKAGVNPLDAGSEKDKEVLFEEKDSEDSERESIEMVSASAGVPT